MRWLHGISNDAKVGLLGVILGVCLSVIPTILINARDCEERLTAEFGSLAIAADRIRAQSGENQDLATNALLSASAKDVIFPPLDLGQWETVLGDGNLLADMGQNLLEEATKDFGDVAVVEKANDHYILFTESQSALSGYMQHLNALLSGLQQRYGGIAAEFDALHSELSEKAEHHRKYAIVLADLLTIAGVLSVVVLVVFLVLLSTRHREQRRRTAAEE